MFLPLKSPRINFLASVCMWVCRQKKNAGQQHWHIKRKLYATCAVILLLTVQEQTSPLYKKMIFKWQSSCCLYSTINMITRLKALKVMQHFTGYIPQMQYTREQENRKSHAKPKHWDMLKKHALTAMMFSTWICILNSVGKVLYIKYIK